MFVLAVGATAPAGCWRNACRVAVQFDVLQSASTSALGPLLTAAQVQVERKREAEATGAPVEDDPRTIPDDRGNYAIMHAITRGNNSMAALLDACATASHFCAGHLPQSRRL